MDYDEARTLRVLTVREKASKVADAWRKVYLNGDATWDDWRGTPDKENIHKALVALGNSPAPKDVADAIGNSSWVRLGCKVSRKSVDSVVVIEGPDPYDDPDYYICRQCATDIVVVSVRGDNDDGCRERQ